MAVILNQEFRAASAQANYPFTAESTLAQGALEIDTGCFLDALLYPVAQRHPAPYFISKLNGNREAGAELELAIADSLSAELGRVVCDTLHSTAMVEDANGRVAGVVVYDPELLGELLGKVGRAEVELEDTVARFAAGVCFNPASEGLLAVAANGGAYTGDVVVCAAGGLTFEHEFPEPPVESSSLSSASSATSGTSSVSSPSSTSSASSSSSSSTSQSSTSESSASSASSSSTQARSSSSSSSNYTSSSTQAGTSSSTEAATTSSSTELSSASSTSVSSSSSLGFTSSSSSSSELLTTGYISINLYGEQFRPDPPVRTVNGRAMEHLWLAAHPDAAVRVRAAGAAIEIGKGKDFGLAT